VIINAAPGVLLTPSEISLSLMSYVADGAFVVPVNSRVGKQAHLGKIAGRVREEPQIELLPVLM
jgi:hypothetical protein